MAFDAHKNFAVSSVAVAPSPAASGTSLTVATGEGVRFPAAPFNVTVCPTQALATPANAEIVRVTAIAGDVLTITRAQEGSTARAIAVGDLIAATITAKTVTDLESGTNFPQLATPGIVTVGGGAPNNAWIRTDTLPGADTKNLLLYGGGGTPDTVHGAIVIIGGKEAGGGNVGLYGATGTGVIDFNPAATYRGRMLASGGFSWGDTPVDPGANNFSVKGSVTAGDDVVLTKTGGCAIRLNTLAGADNAVIGLVSSGGAGNTRGAYLNLFGNQYPGNAGNVDLVLGTPSGRLQVLPGGGSPLLVHTSGGLAVGTTTDPGTGRAIVPNGVSSLRGTVTGPNATPTTLFAASLPVGQVAAFLVAAGLGVNDAANYGAVALVVCDGGSARIGLVNNATLFTLSLSGLNVQATQSSGSPQPIIWSALRIQ
jgi:hypothetical protein